MDTSSEKLPYWDLSNVYPGLDYPEFERSYEKVASLLDDFDFYLDSLVLQTNPNLLRYYLIKIPKPPETVYPGGIKLCRYQASLRLSLSAW